MARMSAMCDFCKLDKICNYECVIKKQDGYKYGFMNTLYLCPNFIYNNGQSITNAEVLSTNIKNDVDSAAAELWNKILQDLVDFESLEYKDFVKWLKSKADISKKVLNYEEHNF